MLHTLLHCILHDDNAARTEHNAIRTYDGSIYRYIYIYMIAWSVLGRFVRACMCSWQRRWNDAHDTFGSDRDIKKLWTYGMECP
jgi:hypothetical protein